MRKKASKCARIVSYILVFVMLVSSASASVVLPSDVERFSYIDEFYATLSISNQYNAAVAVYASTSVPSCSISADVELQKSVDKLSWSKEASWTSQSTEVLSMQKTRYVSSENYYRVKAKIKVYNSNGVLVETATKYSVICP